MRHPRNSGRADKPLERIVCYTRLLLGDHTNEAGCVRSEVFVSDGRVADA